MSGGPCAAIGKGGRYFSACLDKEGIRPVGCMILCGDRLGDMQWNDRRGRSGFPSQADIGRRNEKKWWY